MPTNPPIAIVMGSQSDWATMRHAADTLDQLGIEYEARIVSAHRTPDRMYEFAKSAEDLGFKTIIAGAGGAAHLPGMVAALTHLPVFGVPVQSKAYRVWIAFIQSFKCPLASRSAHWRLAKQAPPTPRFWLRR